MQRYSGRWQVFAVAAAALAWAGCLGGGIDTGSDGETAPIAIYGRVVNSSGAPVAGATVKLFPSGHNPASPGSWTVRDAVTDFAGRFFFQGSGLFASKDARAAYYAVVVRGADGLQWSFADSLRPRANYALVDTLRLSAPRRLVISLHADSAFGPAIPGVAYLAGTDILLSLGAASSAVDSVPANATRLVLRAHSGWSRTVLLPLRDPGGDLSVRDTLRIFGAPTGARIEP